MIHINPRPDFDRENPLSYFEDDIGLDDELLAPGEEFLDQAYDEECPS